MAPEGLLDSPATIPVDWPTSRTATLLSLALFGYFFGTVLHVKSLIRERGNSRIELASLLWHLAWTVATLPNWGFTTSWAWTALFALAAARTATLSRIARTRPVPPADRLDRGGAEHAGGGVLLGR